MATSTRAFLVELYEEYLEEASFLYGQRLGLLENPEISWKKVREFEERFEAHIDGLVVGEERALAVCKKHAMEGDFGELHAAVRVFCRQGRRDLVFSAIQQIDLEDPERITALADALKYELPRAWYSDLLLILKGRPELAPTLMAVLGYRRADIFDDFSRVLRSCPPSYAGGLMWTAGRIGNISLERELSQYFDSSDRAVRSAAALALLRLGDERALRYCQRIADGEAWQLISLGLAGTRSNARALLESSAASKADNDWLIALGLLGDVSAVPALLSKLGNPKSAAAAARALQLISGAGFSESIFVPDEIDEDEVFEDEREKLRQGQVPLRGDGKPFGVTVVRLSQKVEDWFGWWSENGPAFDPRMRYRHGTLYSPMSLLENLESHQTPYRLRQLAYEELVIRYGMDVRFEADMFVSDQMRALAQIDEWIQANKGRFREGAWYFHGNLMY